MIIKGVIRVSANNHNYRNTRPGRDIMKRIAVVTLIVAVVFCMYAIAVYGGDNSAKEKAAEDAAKAWLAVVDGGNYAQSWKDAAKFFKDNITQSKWEEALNGVRTPLGKMISRKLKSKTYTTTIPGGPDGEYVIIQYTTSFEKKKSAVETVTPVLDKDGKWKVSGYFIK